MQNSIEKDQVYTIKKLNLNFYQNLKKNLKRKKKNILII